VQAVVQDFRCHELMSMLEQQRARDTEVHAKGGPDAAAAGIQDVIRYRRQAEALVGTDENLFRIDWVRGAL
jgi:paired amphipathic helix protein Sin3a